MLQNQTANPNDALESAEYKAGVLINTCKRLKDIPKLPLHAVTMELKAVGRALDEATGKVEAAMRALKHLHNREK